MENLNEDGAKAAGTAMAPWVMKYRVRHPYTHRQNNSVGKKTTGQPPHNNAYSTFPQLVIRRLQSKVDIGIQPRLGIGVKNEEVEL